VDKLLERQVYRLIMEHITAHHPLPDNQWGFLPGRATTAALLTTVDEWHTLPEMNSTVTLTILVLSLELHHSSAVEYRGSNA